MNDSSADNELKCWELAQEVSEKNFRILLRNRGCDVLVKEVTAFCSGPKSLPGANV